MGRHGRRPPTDPGDGDLRIWARSVELSAGNQVLIPTLACIGAQSELCHFVLQSGRVRFLVQVRDTSHFVRLPIIVSWTSNSANLLRPTALLPAHSLFLPKAAMTGEEGWRGFDLDRNRGSRRQQMDGQFGLFSLRKRGNSRRMTWQGCL